MENKLFVTILMTAVAVIIVGAALAPFVAETVSDQYEHVYYSNDVDDNQIYLSPITSETSNTITVSSAGIVSDTGDIAYWSDTDYLNVVLICENICVQAYGSGSIIVQTADGSVTATTFTAVVSAGEITYSVDDADSVSTTYTAGYITTVEGDYISCATSQTNKYFDSENFAQSRYDSAFYVYMDGVAYVDGAVGSMTVDFETVDDTEEQVNTLTSIRYSSTKALNSPVVMEVQATYSYTDNPGVVSVLAVVVPIVLLCIMMGVFALVKRD